EVVGRYEDALIFQNRKGEDDFIHPIVIVELLVSGLRSWQVILVDKTSFMFRAQFEPGLSDEEKRETRRRIDDRLRLILAEKEMQNVRFEIQEADSLWVDKRSGKFRLIVHNGESPMSVPYAEASPSLA